MSRLYSWALQWRPLAGGQRKASWENTYATESPSFMSLCSQRVPVTRYFSKSSEAAPVTQITSHIWNRRDAGSYFFLSAVKHYTIKAAPQIVDSHRCCRSGLIRDGLNLLCVPVCRTRFWSWACGCCGWCSSDPVLPGPSWWSSALPHHLEVEKLQWLRAIWHTCLRSWTKELKELQ